MNAPTIWNRLSAVVAVLLFAAGALAVGIWYLPEIQRNQELQTERLQLERQLAAARAYGDALRNRIVSFTNNPAAAERLIRERFGFAKPGETVVHFEAPRPTPNPARR